MYGLSEEELDYLDSWSEIIEGTGDNYGSKRAPTHKNGDHRDGRRFLSGELSAHIAFAKQANGVSSYGKGKYSRHGMKSDRDRSDSTRTLTSEESEVLSPAARHSIKMSVLSRMGLTLGEWEKLNEAPCQDKQLVAKFDAAVYEIKESGGRINDLARCLGITLKPLSGKRRGKGATSCPRLQDCIRRHKARLANPEDYGVTTCAAVRCDAKFYRQSPRQKYCSSACQESERNRRIRLRNKQKREQVAA